MRPELYCLKKVYLGKKKIADEFIEKFVQKTERLNVGDPLSDETDIGPLVNAKSLENMERIVNKTVKEDGAELLLGGQGE